MITSIAEIRARHVLRPPAMRGASAAPAAPAAPPPLHHEGADWVATVGQADITRTGRADGGYQLYVGRRLVVVVEGPDREGRHVVINQAAGRVRSPAIARGLADTMAMRIARNEALA